MGKTKTTDRIERRARQLLERHDCPLPFHEVRAFFLGCIASPSFDGTPFDAIKALWDDGGPDFANVEEVNEMLDALVMGLWNDLTRHQDPATPFRLTRVSLAATPRGVDRFAGVRAAEIDGFLDGLFWDDDDLELPEPAIEAVEHLEDLASIMTAASIVAIKDEDEKQSLPEIRDTVQLLKNAARVMEDEINTVVLICAESRRALLPGLGLPWRRAH